MATESASISLGVVLGNTSKKSGSASCVVMTGSLVQPQPYSGGTGVIVSATTANNKLQLPHVSAIFGTTDDGRPVRMSQEWYRFLSQLFDQRLGGPQGVSINDLSTTVVDTRAQAIAATTAVSSVSQQVNANAQALGAVVQVAQTNSLSGSTQIPPVIYSPKGLYQR